MSEYTLNCAQDECEPETQRDVLRLTLSLLEKKDRSYSSTVGPLVRQSC